MGMAQVRPPQTSRREGPGEPGAHSEAGRFKLMKDSCSDTIGNPNPRTQRTASVLPCSQFSGVVFIMTVVCASFHVIFHCPFVSQSTAHNIHSCASEPSEARWNQEGGPNHAGFSYLHILIFPTLLSSSTVTMLVTVSPPKCREFNTTRRYIPEDFNLQLRLLTYCHIVTTYGGVEV